MLCECPPALCLPINVFLICTAACVCTARATAGFKHIHVRVCLLCLCARLCGGIGGDDASAALATHASISIRMCSLCFCTECVLYMSLRRCKCGSCHTTAVESRQNSSRDKARGDTTPPADLTPHPTPLAPAHRIPSTTRCRRGRLAPLAGALALCGGCFRA